MMLFLCRKYTGWWATAGGSRLEDDGRGLWICMSSWSGAWNGVSSRTWCGSSS